MRDVTSPDNAHNGNARFSNAPIWAFDLPQSFRAAVGVKLSRHNVGFGPSLRSVSETMHHRREYRAVNWGPKGAKTPAPTESGPISQPKRPEM